MKRQQDIHRILEDFKGVRNIPGIKSAQKRVLVTKMKNDKGEWITSRKGIADVFGEFYKRLYEDKEEDDSEHELGDDDNRRDGRNSRDYDRRVANRNQQT